MTAVHGGSDPTSRCATASRRSKDLEGSQFSAEVAEAAFLLAAVVGQGIEQTIEQTEDGTFRIAQRTAPDRVISAVDPEARHGHTSSAHAREPRGAAADF